MTPVELLLTRLPRKDVADTLQIRLRPHFARPCSGSRNKHILELSSSQFRKVSTKRIVDGTVVGPSEVGLVVDWSGRPRARAAMALGVALYAERLFCPHTLPHSLRTRRMSSTRKAKHKGGVAVVIGVRKGTMPVDDDDEEEEEVPSDVVGHIPESSTRSVVPQNIDTSFRVRLARGEFVSARRRVPGLSRLRDVTTRVP